MNDTLLFIIIQSVCAAVIGWIGIVIALTLGFVTAKAIILCAAAGFIVGFPVAWVIKNRMTQSK